MIDTTDVIEQRMEDVRQRQDDLISKLRSAVDGDNADAAVYRAIELVVLTIKWTFKGDDEAEYNEDDRVLVEAEIMRERDGKRDESFGRWKY